MDDHDDRDALAGQYAELLSLQAESGLSMAEFAGHAGVSPATLYGWRRRLGHGGRGAKLVEVQVSGGETHAADRGGMRVRVGERFQIELGADFEEEALVRLVGALSRC